MDLRLLSGAYTVCRLAGDDPLPAWFALDAPLAAAIRRDGELSLICDAAAVPAGVTAEGPWRALEVAGPLDFALTGVMAQVAVPLGEAGVSILPLATYDTDVVLVGADRLHDAIAALRAPGHTAAA